MYCSFITFRPCKYLDGKHTIFGRVVGGTDTLTAIEKLETDSATDRPLVSVSCSYKEMVVEQRTRSLAVLCKSFSSVVVHRINL